MDLRYFLEQRLSFVSQFYINSAKPFADRKRMIEAEEEPYLPPYSDDPEPAFLSDWLEAEESLQVLGHASVCILSASLHLYLKTMERELRVPVGEKYKSDFKRGWFNGYKSYFLKEFNVAFEDSRCNLGLFEELVLARNHVQHPKSIVSHSSFYSVESLRKLSSPFFINEIDAELLNQQEGELGWLMQPAIYVTPEKFLAMISEIARFADWLESCFLRR